MYSYLGELQHKQLEGKSMKKRLVNVRIEKDGAVVTKTMQTRRSNESLLKKLKRDSEPTARIMTLNGIMTLVTHFPFAMITVG